MKFQIFGSENSQDYDVMVFIDSIPAIVDEGHSLCKFYNADIAKILNDKEINTNLAVVKDGYITDVFKGTVDEVNNSLFYTYDNHTQYYPRVVSAPIDRDIDKKILRVYRNIVSYFSRSELRSIVKPALRGNLYDKIAVLKMIDFNTLRDINKKDSMTNIYKIISFQYGQLFSLIDGFESDSYTKNGIIRKYPALSRMINREVMLDSDYITLNTYRDRLIEITESRIDKMKSLVE